MFRIDSSNNSSSLPAAAAPGTPGYFITPAPAPGVSGTDVSADWLNAVQEELMNILTTGGVAPVKGTNSQVLAALYKLFAPVRGFVVMTASGNLVVPAGVTQLGVKLWAGGGGGGAGGGGVGAGGNAGNCYEGLIPIAAGSYPVTIGAGGASEIAGGASSFGTSGSGTYVTVPGGNPGGAGSSTPSVGTVGTVNAGNSGANFIIYPGSVGSNGLLMASGNWQGGAGGAARAGSRAVGPSGNSTTNTGGLPGNYPGDGGSGGLGTGAGGAGAPGLAIFTW